MISDTVTTNSTFAYDIFVAVVDVVLLGIGYIVGRVGFSASITDMKNDISTIKNWIDPSVATVKITQPVAVTPVASGSISTTTVS